MIAWVTTSFKRERGDEGTNCEHDVATNGDDEAMNDSLKHDASYDFEVDKDFESWLKFCAQCFSDLDDEDEDFDP